MSRLTTDQYAFWKRILLGYASAIRPGESRPSTSETSPPSRPAYSHRPPIQGRLDKGALTRIFREV